MASVKRKSSSGTGLSPYVKRLKSPTPKPRDCSFRGVAKKFKELDYMTKVSPTISTGNKVKDKVIAKTVARAANFLVKEPRLKLVIEGCKKAYPYVGTGGANVARAIVTYDEMCRKK